MMLEDDAIPRFKLEAAGEDGGDGECLERLRLGLLKHPAAARRLFSAMVEEGSRYAMTPEGGEWRTRIESAPIVPWLQEVFNTATGRLLVEDPGRLLPSTLLDAFFGAALKSAAPSPTSSLKQTHGTD